MNLKHVMGAVLLLVSGAVAANPAPGPTPAAMLKDGVDALLSFMGQQPRPDADAVNAFLDRRIAPYIDFERMARGVAGPMARRMSAEQKAALVADLKRHFLAKLANRLAGYGGQNVRYLRPVMGRNGMTASAGVVVLNPGAYPARIDFRLYRSERGWLVYDVAANGQSAIVHFRRALRHQLQRHLREQVRPMGAYPAPARP